MSEILFQTVVVLHLLGMAVILGGAVTELFARRLRVPAPVLYGAVAQVVTGVALVGMASAGMAGASPNNAKAAAKLLVALAVLIVAVLARRSVLDGRLGLPAVGLLALGNVLVAVYW
jgi:hypothetical protein